VSETTLKRGRGSSLSQTVSRFVAGIVATFSKMSDIPEPSFFPVYLPSEKISWEKKKKKTKKILNPSRI